MNNKTLRILFGIFMVLLLAAFYPTWSKLLKPDNGQLKNSEINFSSLTKDSVDSIKIKNTTQEIQLAKDNGKWKIGNLEASEQSLDDFFEQVSKLKVESLVSKNKQNHTGYGVTEKDGILLSFTQDKSSTEFIIGNSAVSASGFYVRKQNADNVYLVTGGMLKTQLTRGADDWRDKIIVDVAKDNFEKAEVNVNTAVYVISKTQEGKLEAEVSGQKQILDSGISDKFFTALRPLRADGFLSEAEIKEFQGPSGKVVIRLSEKNKQPAQLQLLRKGEDFWVKVSDRETYYKISAGVFNEIINLQK